MALKNQVIPATLQAGLDTGKDPKLVSQGLLILENSIMDKQGELSKRAGLVSLDGTHTNENLATYKDRVMTIGATAQRHAGATSTTGGFKTLGNAGSMDVGVFSRASQSYTHVLCAEIQEVGSYQVVAWQEVDNIALTYVWKLAVYDRYSGVLLSSIEDTYQIRIIKLDGVVYYFKPAGANGVLQYSKIDADGGINTSMQTITGCSATLTAADGGAMTDLCIMDTGTDDLMLVHCLSTGSGIEMLTWDGPAFGAGTWTAGTLLAPTTVAGVGCCRRLDGEAVVAYIDSGASPRTVVCEAFDIDLSGTVSAIEVLTDAGSDAFNSVVMVRMTDDRTRVYITMSASSENAPIIAYNTFINTAGTGSAEQAKANCPAWAFGVMPVSKPFEASDGKHYMLLQRKGYSLSDPNWGYYIFDEDGDPQARVLPGYAYHITDFVGAFYARATDQWVLAAIKRTDQETSALMILEVDFDPGQIHSVESPEHLLIAGSCPWEADGQALVEQGFPWWPFNLTATRAAPGGATDIGVGDYGYMVCYEWYDNRGALHRGRPSPVATITTTTVNDVVTLTIPNLFNTRKTNVSIAIYRTALNGSVYYRVKAVTNGAEFRTQTVTDSVADSTITDNAFIYTTGGVYGNEPPPPYRAHCVHQRRHVLVNREAESWDIRYSKEFVPNEGIAHTGFLTIKCDPAGGRITALASFGDRLLIFKEDRIYATNGSGKTTSGQGQGYREPYLVSESVGCVNQKTIVETPAGLLFEGADGIYALDKTFRVQAIGEPARYHYEQITLKSAALVADKHYVVFVSSDGVALVFDYMHGQWMEFTNHEATDCTVAQGILYIKTASGDDVKAENRGNYQDDGSLVAMRIRTGWISFAGLGGFKRVREILPIGQNVSHHILRAKTAYDFDLVFVDSQAFDSSDLANYKGPSSHYGASLAAGYKDKAYLLSVATSRQKCTSIMLEITDENPDGVVVAEGFTLSGLSFLVALKDGLKRLGAGRQL